MSVVVFRMLKECYEYAFIIHQILEGALCRPTGCMVVAAPKRRLQLQTASHCNK